MKKILLVAALAVVFLCTFFLIFFTGNDKNIGVTPNETTENGEDKNNEKVYDYDLNEYVTIGAFPKVAYDTAKVDELVSDTINQVASNFAEKKEITDRAVKSGDTVNIDYVGTMDGVAFDGGTDQGYDLVIGSGNFIPGFEDGLIGHSVGEEVVLDIKFPDSYHVADLKGKPVVFTVKINKITETVVPELTDVMVASLQQSNYKTVEEFNLFITNLATREVIWETYVKSCEIKKYPDKEVNRYISNVISNYTIQAQYYSMTLDTLLSAMGFSGLDDFKAYIEGDVKDTVATEMVIYQTVREKKIEISDDEYKTYALEIAKENGISSIEELEKQVDKNYITTGVYQKKIINMLFDASESE
ncbi:MAG: FKBP-type peptidyl-prolyl cis-trans isomerase [Clostridia bacterium]|nr:FKBP-type peptidyl-prolyl cis-trans isomerase [Clostridia bacterium]